MFKNKLLNILYLLLMLGLSSCITSNKINYMQTPGFNIPAYNDSLSYQDYRLRIGDRLYVRVY